MKTSVTEENYLKAIYKLSELSSPVSTTDIANSLNIKSATVTDMIKKLAQKKLIRYERYHGLHLTEKGRQAGIRIIRKHRLWELFLVEKMKFRWDEVHEIAEQLEHIQSDELVNRLDELLGFPSADPHGDPIPDKAGVFGTREQSPLSTAKTEVALRVSAVSENDPALLQHLDKLFIAIGSTIKVEGREAYDNSLRISVNEGVPVFISESVASRIFVQSQ
jgi:DtxR family transcriptional regulator, Mn-dependent transcriptional regulator